MRAFELLSQVARVVTRNARQTKLVEKSANPALTCDELLGRGNCIKYVPMSFRNARTRLHHANYLIRNQGTS